MCSMSSDHAQSLHLPLTNDHLIYYSQCHLPHSSAMATAPQQQALASLGE